MGTGARVLVVDDHPLFLRGLRAVLELEPWVEAVSEAATVAEAVRRVVTEPIDVVAMDIRLPDGDGIDATRRILSARPAAVVLLLTMVDDPDVVARGLRAGAQGYVLKDAESDAVVEAIRTVHRGGLALGPTVATIALTTLRAAPVPLPPPFDRLTRREREVAAHLAEGRNNQQIARALGLSEKTIRNTVSAVLAKLHAPDRVRAALLAREAGLTLTG